MKILTNYMKYYTFLLYILYITSGLQFYHTPLIAIVKTQADSLENIPFKRNS